MSTITRYYGTVDANTNILTTIDTTPIPANKSFTIDVFYGGRPVDNPTAETTWLYRYILTYNNISGITLKDTHNVLEYALNGPYPLTSSINDPYIDLIVNTSVVSDPAQTITIYDCYLNYN
jgi:hypothetical protein